MYKIALYLSILLTLSCTSIKDMKFDANLKAAYNANLPTTERLEAVETLTGIELKYLQTKKAELESLFLALPSYLTIELISTLTEIGDRETLQIIKKLREKGPHHGKVNTSIISAIRALEISK